MRRLTFLVTAALLTIALTVPAHAGVLTDAAAAPGPATATVLVRTDSAEVHRRLGYRVANRLEALGVDVVVVPRGQVTEALRRYAALPEVDYAEANRIVRLANRPNDSQFGHQYALPRIRAPRGWAVYGNRWRAGGGAPIAVIDSGIDTFHPEFDGKISHCRSWLTGLGIGLSGCQDTQFHGTHVSGIAAARTNNGTGIAGVAFDSPIMALQAFNSAGTAWTADVAAAIVYAADNGARVANYSFSAETPNQTERRAVAYAHSRRVTQVAAAGNTGRAGVQYPARYGKVIAVSATNRRDTLASFSTRGGAIEVAAPGEAILSTLPGTLLYGEFDGTSMAAPHVAGLAALLRSSGYSMAQTRRRIRAGAVDLGPAGRDGLYGFGRIDVLRSLR
ncbi:MAG TPA: S8 family serine peptidase [Egibacteraceae bacterium]|nr:S8 family serine peptidase [Egibacteraceae bacterium]